MDSMPVEHMPSDSSSAMNMAMIMMKPYFHFTAGDIVLFKSVAPRTAGAIFGACIVTFILAILSRYTASVARGVHHRCALSSKMLLQQYNSQDSETQNVMVIPPSRFIFSRELTRSVVVGIEVILHYTLMLIVMTFNVAYIISLVVGAMVGELLFGRLHRIAL